MKTATKVKRLIVIRHAHRDTSDRTLDNGLSEKGWKQARALQKFAASEFTPSDLNSMVLWTSAKLRCQETLSPMADLFKREVVIESLLHEQRHEESESDFVKRIDAFLKHFQKNGPDLAIACSHGDVIPVLIEKAVGIPASVQKASWTELQWDGKKFELIQLLQDVTDATVT